MISTWHILLVLIGVLILFGAGKLPKVMGDIAKGIKSFKEGMSEEETPAQKPKVIEARKSPSKKVAKKRA